MLKKLKHCVGNFQFLKRFFIWQILELIFNTNTGEVWFKGGELKILSGDNVLKRAKANGILESGFTICACTHSPKNFIEILEFERV